jgi:hypothetical protein
MTAIDVLDDIISHLDPEDVPVEFIVMAQVTDFNGVEKIIKGDALEELLMNPEMHQIAELRVILNVRKIRKAIMEEVNAVYDEANRLFNSRDQ